MFQRCLFSVFLLIAITSTAYSSEDIWSFRDQRVGLGFLYLHQDEGGDVSTGNLIYDFNFFHKDAFQINGSVMATAYKDSATTKTFLISAYRLIGSYQIAETNFKSQILSGYQLWEGRGLKFEYAVGVEYGLQNFEFLKSFINSAFFQIGRINDSNTVTFVNLGVYKNF